MGCGQSKEKLCLPQQCTPEELKERNDKIAKAKEAYALVQVPGLPPKVKSVPTCEEVTAKGVMDLTSLFYGLIVEKVDLRLAKLKNNLTKDCKDKDEPFYRFTAVYDDDEVPAVNSVWKTDAEWGYQHINGYMPHFIAKADPVPEKFKVTEEDVKKRLAIYAGGKSLAELSKAGRIFISDVCGFCAGVPAQPDTNNVITAPMALFVVTDDGKFMPIAITLEQENGLVVTPDDDEGLGLCYKLHVTCAEFQVFMTLVHALSEHFVTEVVWSVLNQNMADSHPIHAFLKPHTWNTIFVNAGFRDSLMGPANVSGTSGAIQYTLQGGQEGTTELVKRAWAGLDWKDFYDIPNRFKRHGVMDIPNYWFRDDAISLWNLIKKYADDFIKAVYKKPEDIAKDTELQGWLKNLADPNVGGMKGLPVNAKGEIDNADDLSLFLTGIMFQCGVRHSHLENCAPNYYSLVCAYPSSFKFPVPKTKEAVSMKDIDEKYLPDQNRMINQCALIESKKVANITVRPLGVEESDNLKDAGEAANKAANDFQAGLKTLDTEMKSKAEARAAVYPNPVTYNFLYPSKLAVSIWN